MLFVFQMFEGVYNNARMLHFLTAVVVSSSLRLTEVVVKRTEQRIKRLNRSSLLVSGLHL